MNETKHVLLRYRDGRVANATVDAIDPAADSLTAVIDHGPSRQIPYSELKAVFFPREVPEELLEPGGGMTLAVELFDGEVIRGTAHYNPEKNGFFLVPADRTRHDRIFIVNSAIHSIEVEKL
ncbi:MAG TPA: hypothetical protein VNL91_10305 [Thermoanaerobaculia bacterium]|nr:hypothetical protein [Thermoanaerobaculia bacterium]